MHVFVTGATGFVGSAVVRNLLDAGHRVTGLARSDAGAAALSGMGAGVHRGDLAKPDGFASAAAAADGVIHCGFTHDFTRFRENCEQDRRVIGALGAAMAGTGKLLIVTSGTALVSGAGVATEEMTVRTSPDVVPRAMTERAAEEAAAAGTKVAIVRLSPSVHGAGDHGFVPMLIDMAVRNGRATYIGEGANVWPGVNRLDAAELYRRAIEKGLPGRYHASDETGVPMREIATIIGRRLGLLVESLSGEAVTAYFGWFSHFAAIDNPTSSTATRAALGWQPRHAGLIEELDSEVYFPA